MGRPQFDRRSLAHLRGAILPSRGLGRGTAVDGEALQGLTLLWLVVALPCLQPRDLSLLVVIVLVVRPYSTPLLLEVTGAVDVPPTRLRVLGPAVSEVS